MRSNIRILFLKRFIYTNIIRAMNIWLHNNLSSLFVSDALHNVRIQYVYKEKCIRALKKKT